MVQTHPLQLAFRGGRDYLQGADLYQALVDFFGDRMPPGPLTLVFHQFLRHQPDVVWPVEDLLDWRARSDYRGELRAGSGEAMLRAVLLESERPVTERRACNEAEVVAAAEVDAAERRARLAFPCPGTVMEMTVFLNKQLHFQVLPEVKEKWLFVKLESDGVLPGTGGRELTLELAQVLGNRFTRARIAVDGKPCGHISFSTLK